MAILTSLLTMDLMKGLMMHIIGQHGECSILLYLSHLIRCNNAVPSPIVKDNN